MVREDRTFLGSVSGGCVEGAVIEEAREVMADGGPRTLEFGVSDDEAWAVGLACGGRVRILVRREEPGSPVLAALLEARVRGEAVVVATRMDSGARALLHPMSGADSVTEGFEPGPDVLAKARAALRADRSGPVTSEDGEVFLRVENAPLRLVVVGAVHIAQPLARMAAAMGLRVTVVDPRRAFATTERFPGVTLVTSWPDEALRNLALDHRTAVVTLTHDPKLDDPALRAALASEAFYVGALGSRRTHGRRLERLRDEGVEEDALARIHGPVGLDIGARTPAEIAVSILAELTARLREEPEE